MNILCLRTVCFLARSVARFCSRHLVTDPIRSSPRPFLSPRLSPVHLLSPCPLWLLRPEQTGFCSTFCTRSRCPSSPCATMRLRTSTSLEVQCVGCEAPTAQGSAPATPQPSSLDTHARALGHSAGSLSSHTGADASTLVLVRVRSCPLVILIPSLACDKSVLAASSDAAAFDPGPLGLHTSWSKMPCGRCAVRGDRVA